jgi:5,6-dimethylbenzimidazole synthase
MPFVELRALLEQRRDVRHFRSQPVDAALVERLLETAMLAPSVGYSQPWRWVMVESEVTRARIAEHHETAKSRAGAHYDGEQADLYRSLKLSGLREAPVNIAVFSDNGATRGHGLGRQTMPETVEWSAVMAIHTLWLAATAEGLGLGWVSILEPDYVAAALQTPPEWRFLAWLCLGYPEEARQRPLLETLGWEQRAPLAETILRR